MKKFGYREDNTSAEVYDIESVLYFEMYELQNKDIPIYIADQYNLHGQLDKFIDNDDPTEKDVEDAIVTILKAVGPDIKYALWLCDTEEDVREFYTSEGWDFEINKYPVGDVILSDLGEQGKLWGYINMPEMCED